MKSPEAEATGGRLAPRLGRGRLKSAQSGQDLFDNLVSGRL